MFNQETLDWLLLLGRWLHITVAITWIGTSIFFMWLDRTFIADPKSKREGHVGELWMVHGGGFYQVEKMLMGPTKVPQLLHWFKWESYWTWMSGMFLLILTYYTGSGTYLLDPSISDLSYYQALALCLFSIFGSWFFYDFVWERGFTKTKPIIGHLLTLAWFVFMTILLCTKLSGRAAFIHIGGMLGTWMAFNVFARIIPRQVKMVKAAKEGQAVNLDWAINAKNRSTHNTYFTLPVIFIMISNHFPATYGHELNWLCLIFLTLAGAFIRQYFVIRLNKASFAKSCAALGIIFIMAAMFLTKSPSDMEDDHGHVHQEQSQHQETSDLAGQIIDQDNIDQDSLVNEEEGHTEVVKNLETNHLPTATPAGQAESSHKATLTGSLFFQGTAKKAKKLRLPGVCAKQFKGDVYSDETIVNNGKLENVFVRISQGLENKVYNDVPPEAVRLDQKGCIYKPRVIAARVNQKVTFINSDKVFHNVKSVTKNNKRFNLAMPRKNQEITKTFTSAELFLQTKCSIHPWMQAFVAIVDHPFFDVSRKDGTFTIKDVPAGSYVLEAWHEVYGTLKKNIVIKDSTTQTIDFTFKGLTP